MTNENHQLIKLDQDLSDEALAILQEQANTFPAVIETEKQYKEIKEHHQKIKKISQAVKKKSKELIKDSKVKFEMYRANVLNEEIMIKLVLSPIETKLLETRTAWEDKKERIKREKAEIEGKKQQAEHERQEKIRDEIEAHAENEKFDQRKREDEARRVEDIRLLKEKAEAEALKGSLEAERLAFEAEKAEFEAKKLETLPIKVVPECFADQEKVEWLGKATHEELQEKFGGASDISKILGKIKYDEDGCELIKSNVDVHVIPIPKQGGLKPDEIYTPELDPDKAKFDAIFAKYNEFYNLIDVHLEVGFADPNSAEAALYIKKRLDEFYKDVTTTFTF